MEDASAAITERILKWKRLIAKKQTIHAPKTKR